jgi:hypothetical protein
VKREEVPVLLNQASDLLPEPDFADAAWAGGLAIRRRRRRSTVSGLVAVLLVAIVAAFMATLGGKSNSGIVPPTTPPSNPPGFISPAGQIAGIDFWNAPPAGSEPWLDRVDTPLGDKLQLPSAPADLRGNPLEQVAAVVLSEHNGTYTPLLLDSSSHWARADLELQRISTGEPLSAGAIAPNGKLVAFPQSGGVAVVDATTATTKQIQVPAQDVRSVSWLPDSSGLLVSGPGAAYRVEVDVESSGEPAVVAVAASNDADAATAPYRLDGPAGRVAVMQYSTSSGWSAIGSPRLPVTSWVGQTFAAGNLAARLFIATPLPQVPTAASQPQVVAAISPQQGLSNRLLVLGETPAATPTPGRTTPDAIRTPGCCFVLGWYDDHTALLQVKDWVLGWDLQTGQVRRVTELDVAGVALGPGIRG